MEEEIEDVKAESSAANEVEVEEQIQDVNQEESSTSTAQDTSVQTGDVDEKGVPWKNREAEIRRKVTEEMTPFIQQQIQEGIKQYQSQNVVKPAQAADPIQAQLAPYTDDQLEAFASQDVANAHLYRKEIYRRIEDRSTDKAYQKVKGETNKDKFDREQQEAIGFIQQKFPDAFMNIGGQGMWNTGSSLVQRAFAIYNSDPAFKSSGSGLRAAFLQAKGEIALDESGKLTKQKVQLNAQKRKQEKVQSGAMNAGSQSAPVSNQGGAKAKMVKLLEQHKKTGDPKIMAEILRMKGSMPSLD